MSLYLSPTSDVSNANWELIGAASAWDALDDATRAPTVPASGTRIAFQAAADSDVILGCGVLAANTSQIIVSTYVLLQDNGGDAEATFLTYLIVNGVQVGSPTALDSDGQGTLLAAWNSPEWDGTWVGGDEIRIRLRCNDVSEAAALGEVHTAYVQYEPASIAARGGGIGVAQGVGGMGLGL